MSVLTIVAAVNQALKTEMALDPAVIVFGEDVGQEGGVFRATVGLQETYGVERCFDTPLTEGGIVGAAVGMAVAGLKPVVEIQFAGFSYPAFDQLVNHAARLRNRTRGAMEVPLVVRMPYGGGIGAPEHHSESPEALFAHIPGLKVVIPSTPHDTKGLLIAAVRDPDPVIFMEPKRIYRSVKQEVPEDAYTVEIGRAKVVKAGRDLTLVSYGAQMKEAGEAVVRLGERGVSVELIDLRTIYPFDLETVVESVRRTGRILVVHEGPQSFGAAAEIVTSVLEEAFVYLEAPPTRLSGADTVFPLPKAEHHYLITTEQIVDAAAEVAAYRP
ncbi:MAG: alpha-ketoacid dehydrogenase subunit beta [Spirochaetaceae bacterium]|nr:MAG: alpha-ketoacid dehydrogenase subunit beta [Spirochaetaceae bacterium]